FLRSRKFLELLCNCRFLHIDLPTKHVLQVLNRRSQRLQVYGLARGETSRPKSYVVRERCTRLRILIITVTTPLMRHFNAVSAEKNGQDQLDDFRVPSISETSEVI